MAQQLTRGRIATTRTKTDKRCQAFELSQTGIRQKKVQGAINQLSTTNEQPTKQEGKQSM